MTSDVNSASSETVKRRASRWTILLIAVCVIVGLLLVVAPKVLLPVLLAEREDARHALCKFNLHQIGIAVVQYADTHGSFPPAYIADENGRPMHSWRVLILPFFYGDETAHLYEQYDFNEPWDGPNNSRLAKTMPDIYRCPSAADSAGQTHYVAVVGDETMWPGAETVAHYRYADSPGDTIAIVETDRIAVSWLEPRDLTMNEALRGINPSTGPGIASQHPGGACVYFAGGSVQFLEESLSTEIIRALLTRSGGEDVDPSAL